MREERKRVRTTVTVDPDLYAWVNERTGGGKEFASISHAVDRGFFLLKKEDDNNKTPRRDE